VHNEDFITNVVAREEENFRRTLKAGLSILEGELAQLGDAKELPGSVAFVLHDTHGFPLELTEEIVGELDIAVERIGFDEAMARQKQMAAEARKNAAADDAEAYKELLEQFGPTEFTGRDEFETAAHVLGVIGEGDAVSIVLDHTPFYAESGGQVGDTGRILTETGQADVLDTVYAIPGQLTRHKVKIVEGEITAGQEANAAIDVERRDAIRRNHTATHLLHWALRAVLGEHVKQQGSYVGPDRLRFDFSHYEAMTPDEIARVEDLVNAETLANHPARHYETTKDHATEIGAIAFFGDKYGDIVRVLEAGPHSTELCGGTHVRALGDIGAVKVVSEGSIGSNIRRLEAVTGMGPILRLRDEEAVLAQLAATLSASTDELVDAVERQRTELKDLQKQIKSLKQQAAAGHAGDLVDQAVDGVVVARLDGTSRDDLRNLALATRGKAGIRAVVLGGEPDGGGAALVAAVPPDSDLDAGALLDPGKGAIQGGGSSKPDLAMAGGKNTAGIDEALNQARDVAGIPRR
jgi:alanyl-tRNA synthetase